MKKTLFPAFALPLVCAILFSCQSTEGSAKNAADTASLAAEQSAAESAAASENSQEIAAAEDDATGANDSTDANGADASAYEEKIPQSEMEEFSALLDSEEDAEQADDTENQQNASGIAQSENGSLAQKIKDAGKSEADESTDTADLTRLTNQGKEISGGPLIGPASDKVPGGKNAGGEKTAADNQSTPKNAEPKKGASNAPAAANGSNNSGRDNTSDRYNFSDSKNGGESNAAAQAAAQDGQEQETIEEKEEKQPPVPSRSMTIKNNQFLDVIYPGSGWIYLGEEGAGEHFIFQGRKLGKGETTFTLRSKEPGVALLHFYKNDILTGNYIDDYIQISITDKSATDATHVEAPSYAEVVPPKFDRTKAVEEKKVAQAESAPNAPQKEAPAQSKDGEKKPAAKESQPDKKEAAQESPSEKVQTVIQTSGQEKSDSKQKTAVAGTSAPAAEEEQKESALDQGFSGGTDKAKSLLERAQKAYDEKRYAEALDLVQQFFDTASEDFDAGLYLEGLILEAKSEVRNIKSAIGAYDTLIKNWPQSNYWRKANERSIYLKRFYIDIR